MDNLSDIKADIQAVCRDCGADPAAVTLVAVSKTHGADKINPLIAAGQRVFGENRVQEAKEKFMPLKEEHPDLKLHLIGPLQTNKVKEAVALFDVIETVDRSELAEKLAKEMQKQGKNIPCFVQVNTGEESQKAGISPCETVAFVQKCRALGLNIIGLMCIPPIEDEPAPHFAFLKKLAQQAGVKELSMGMSADYPIALQQGATFIRVGSALFGQRN